MCIRDRLIPCYEKYYSLDTAMKAEKTTSYPMEFLNSFELAGTPSYQLQFKCSSDISVQLRCSQIMQWHSIKDHRPWA